MIVELSSLIPLTGGSPPPISVINYPVHRVRVVHVSVLDHRAAGIDVLVRELGIVRNFLYRTMKTLQNREWVMNPGRADVITSNGRDVLEEHRQGFLSGPSTPYGAARTRPHSSSGCIPYQHARASPCTW